eukprot:TRINITY_DN5245_c0_g1_i1.p1 TRINITY_DN5245_c0_g1~~TRINITY_DN5245_c0_g1_i1.p1  ORF type:complete len:305 (-),score=47.44 TRINITY_DN5245_c0_g1_i1:129-1043(-)
MSGTSRGMITNFNGTLWDQQSYFDFLRTKGISWRAYYQDDPWAIMYFQDTQRPENKRFVYELDQFFVDAKSGNLSQFTWLQPRMTSVNGPPTWQHPDASVSEGERLIKSIYEALRTSPVWESLAFVLTYDEHGGFYDHVSPPQENIPAPDTAVSSNGFKFDRLGIRVPTILISPWVKKGIIHDPTSGGPYFDGTSIISTTNKIFGITEHMGDRDKWVGTFEDHFTKLDEMRNDCPSKLPIFIPPYTKEQLKIQRQRPLNDHLQIQVNFYCKFNKHGPDCGKDIHNQYQASVFIVEEAKKFMSNI